MKKVYIVEYIIKKLNGDNKTYSEISKINQEGYSNLKEAQDFCINKRGAIKEISPFWFIVPAFSNVAEIREYKI